MDSERKAELLGGKRVAFTGRLASLTRAEAVKLVEAYGGRFVHEVNRRTSLLIVGQEGWPLQKDGRLTHKLERAQALQRTGCSIAILQEQDWLAQIGLEPVGADIQRLYTTAQLAQLLKIPRDRLRGWIHAGLIQPVQTREGICYFDYGQVADARTLHSLTQAGIKPERIRQSLKQLARWLGSLERPLAQLAALERSGELLVRCEDALFEPTGQRRLDFSEPVSEPTLAVPQEPVTAEEWYNLGCIQEDDGQLGQAAEAYRQALLLGGPNRDASFNVANVLVGLGHREQAVERLYQVLELDAQFADAWNNLGILLQELSRPQEALAALEQALKINPAYAEAHYNLADLLEEIGRTGEARGHWQIYLRYDPQSEWGRHARARLGKNLG
jgi:tetratricopeptide (TPR) repeat protein